MTTIRSLLADGTITLDTVVLGSLSMTRDGCVIGDDCEVVYDNRNGGLVDVNVELFRSPLANERGWSPFIVKRTYSTREAAESARKEPHA